MAAIIYLDIAIVAFVLSLGPSGGAGVAVFVVNYFVLLLVVRKYIWWISEKQKAAGMVEESIW